MEFRFAKGPLTGFDLDVVHTLSDDVEQLAGPLSAPAALRARYARATVAQLRRHQIALVQTILNEAPPARPSIAQQILNAATAAWVVPHPTVQSPSRQKTTIIPFAHYCDRYIGYPRSEMVRSRLLCVNAPDQSDLTQQLTGIARVAETADLSLRIVGEGGPRLKSTVQHENRRTSGRVSASMGKISDGALLQEIDRAELVVQPRIDRFDDHRTVLLALSRQRPVLVPPVESMRRLAKEVGDSWVHVASGPMTAAVIDRVLAASRATPPRAEPNLTARHPRDIADAYAAVYRSARSSLQ